MISSWTQVVKVGGWFSWWQSNFGESVVTIDEVQTSYKDEEFWLLTVKIMDNSAKFRIIIFVSYGSPTSDVVGVIPFPLHDRQRVTLRPSEHEDDIPSVGLYLTKQSSRTVSQSATAPVLRTCFFLTPSLTEH